MKKVEKKIFFVIIVTLFIRIVLATSIAEDLLGHGNASFFFLFRSTGSRLWEVLETVENLCVVQKFFYNHIKIS